MTISYRLNFGGKVIAQWSVEKQIKQIKPPKIVLIPKEILLGEALEPYFRRADVVSCLKTESGFSVQLEAVRMPDPARAASLQSQLLLARSLNRCQQISHAMVGVP